MNKVELLEYLEKNDLENYNFFHTHEDVANEVGIDIIRNTWLIVYNTDEEGKQIDICEYAEHHEAYEDFLSRVKQLNECREDIKKIYKLSIAHYKGKEYLMQYLNQPFIRLFSADLSVMDFGFKKENDLYALDISINECDYIHCVEVQVYSETRYCGIATYAKGDMIHAINENLKDSTSTQLQELGILGEDLHKKDCKLTYSTSFIKGDEEGNLQFYIPSCAICGSDKNVEHVTSLGVTMCEECYMKFCEENVIISELSYQQRLYKIIELLNALGDVVETYIYLPHMNELHFYRHFLLSCIKEVVNSGELESANDSIRYHWCNLFLSFQDAWICELYNHRLKEDVLLELQQSLSMLHQYLFLDHVEKAKIELYHSDVIVHTMEVNVNVYNGNVIDELIQKALEHVDTSQVYGFSITRLSKEQQIDFAFYRTQDQTVESELRNENVAHHMYFGAKLHIITYKTEKDRAKYLWKHISECKEYERYQIDDKEIQSWIDEEAKFKKRMIQKEKRKGMVRYIPYMIIFIAGFLAITYIQWSEHSKQKERDLKYNEIKEISFESEKSKFAKTMFFNYSIIDTEDGNRQILQMNYSPILEADEIDLQRSYLQFYREREYWYMYDLASRSSISDPSSDKKILDYFALNPLGDDGLYHEYFAISFDGENFQIYDSTGSEVSPASYTKDKINTSKFEYGILIEE